MDIFNSDIAILLLSTIGLVATTVSIVLDTRDQEERAATQKVRVEV